MEFPAKPLRIWILALLLLRLFMQREKLNLLDEILDLKILLKKALFEF